MGIYRTAPALAALLFLGCGQDCHDQVRLGDFEYSQGNYPNAIRHYEQALKADSSCGGLRIKKRLEELRRNPSGPGLP